MAFQIKESLHWKFYWFVYCIALLTPLSLNFLLEWRDHEKLMMIRLNGLNMMMSCDKYGFNHHVLSFPHLGAIKKMITIIAISNPNASIKLGYQTENPSGKAFKIRLSPRVAGNYTLYSEKMMIVEVLSSIIFQEFLAFHSNCSSHHWLWCAN